MSAWDFVNMLGRSAVTFIPDLRAYGWDGAQVVASRPAPGWEAISPTGEIRAFDSWCAAHEWRVAECKSAVELGL